MDVDVITIENSQSDEKLLRVFQAVVKYGAESVFYFMTDTLLTFHTLNKLQIVSARCLLFSKQNS